MEGKMKSWMSLGTESRKVVVFAPIFIVSCVFLWLGKVGSAEWVDLIKWGWTALAVGLTAEHFSKS
jgi:hypothetical protein